MVTWKNAEVRQVFRYVTESNTNKCVHLSDFEGFLDCGSQSATLIPLSLDGPSFDTLWVCVPLYIPLNVHIAHCARRYWQISTCRDLPYARLHGSRTDVDEHASPGCHMHTFRSRHALGNSLQFPGTTFPRLDICRPSGSGTQIWVCFMFLTPLAEVTP